MKKKLKKAYKHANELLKISMTALCALVLVMGVVETASLLVRLPSRQPGTQSGLSGTAELMRKHRGSIATVFGDANGGTAGGTGFVVQAPSGKKFVLTNKHVCEIADLVPQLFVKFDDGSRPVPVVVREKSTETDLCIIDLPLDHAPLPLGKHPMQGDLSIVIGHPHLRPLTPSEGVITAADTELEMQNGVPVEQCNGKRMRIESYISFFGRPEKVCIATYHAHMISARTEPGNSGSPVFDAQGEVMGIAFAGGYGGAYGAIIDIDEIRSFIAIY